MDTLSDTLRVMRVTEAVFTNETLYAPWHHRVPSSGVVSAVEAEAEHRVVFHMITEGECFVEVEGQPTLRVTAGDVVLFPNGRTHRMVFAPDRRAASPSACPAAPPLRPTPAAQGDGRAVTRLIRGDFACDLRVTHMLFAGLPPVIRVGIRGSSAGAWLESSIAYALGESRARRPGSEGMLVKLSELLFIEVLRIYVDACDKHDIGWLAGISDRAIDLALNSLHQQPARAWTLDELARTAGTSRSVLAERFRQLMGTTPMQYLTRWRMLLAANLLRHSNTPLTRIAENVGYQTDTAFIRAFRRELGTSPAAWRRLERRAKPRHRDAREAPVEGFRSDDVLQETCVRPTASRLQAWRSTAFGATAFDASFSDHRHPATQAIRANGLFPAPSGHSEDR